MGSAAKPIVQHSQQQRGGFRSAQSTLPGGVDGVTLVKEAMRMRPRMGVLCMSGYDPTRKHRKWFQVQNIEFLEKPFSSARLAQALKDVLAH
jgi:DNA-binding NtrC family response regulator